MTTTTNAPQVAPTSSPEASKACRKKHSCSCRGRGSLWLGDWGPGSVRTTWPGTRAPSVRGGSTDAARRSSAAGPSSIINQRDKDLKRAANGSRPRRRRVICSCRDTISSYEWVAALPSRRGPDTRHAVLRQDVGPPWCHDGMMARVGETSGRGIRREPPRLPPIVSGRSPLEQKLAAGARRHAFPYERRAAGA